MPVYPSCRYLSEMLKKKRYAVRLKQGGRGGSNYLSKSGGGAGSEDPGEH